MATGHSCSWRCIHCGFEIPKQPDQQIQLDSCPLTTCGKSQNLSSSLVKAQSPGPDGDKKKKKRKVNIPPSNSPKFKFVFHALIHKDAWKWTDNLHLNVKLSITEFVSNRNFKILREANGKIEFEGVVELDIYAVRAKRVSGLSYLYYVQGIPGAGPDGWQEQLHGSLHECTHRFLSIPINLERGKEYHQYDSMVFPEVQNPTTAQSEMLMPEYNAMQTEALSIYIDRYKTILGTFKLSQTSSIEFISERMVKILQDLSNYKVCLCVNEEIIQNVQQIECKELDKVMANSLFETVEILYHTDIQNPLFNGKRIASAIAVICCFHHIFLKAEDIPSEITIELLSMLRLMPDIQNKKCVDWDYVIKLIPGTLKESACEAVQAMIVSLSKNDPFQPEWLFSVPVIHLLDGNVQEFQPIVANPRAIPWKDRMINIAGIKDILKHKEISDIERICEDLKPLIALDPLVIQDFIYICPKKQLSKLYPKVHPYISISFIASQMLTKTQILPIEAEEASRDILTLTRCIPSFKDNDFQISWTSTFKASIFLLQETLSRLKTTSEIFMKLLSQTIRLVIECAKQNERSSYIISAHFTKVSSHLTMYIETVIGRPFGFGPEGEFSQGLAKTEIKVWNDIISRFESGEVYIQWRDEVVTKIMERMQKLVLNDVIRLFAIVESVPNCPNSSSIANIFVKAITEKIDDMSTSDVEKLISCSSLKVKIITDKIIENHCGKKIYQVSFIDLITWPYWYIFVKVYKSNVLYKKSDKYFRLFGYAKARLDEVITKVNTSTVTMKDLSEINKRRDNFNNLVAANIVGKEELQSFEQIFKKFINTCESFENHKKHLVQICHHVKVPVKELEAELEDCKRIPINELCKFEDGKVKFLSLSSAFAIDEIACKFDVFYREFSTDIFLRIWEEKVSTTHELLIKHIKTKIWDPTFDECKWLLESLCNRTIKFAEVDKYFLGIEEKERQLYHLHCGVMACMGNDEHEASSSWIPETMKALEDYWSLRKLTPIARMVMILKEKLELFGDFSAIQSIANETIQSVSDITLDYMTEKITEASEFLEKCNNKPKIDCLDAFAASLNIVEWIREETKDISDLHKFVQVALHTSAGEGDFASDRLSRLKTVGSGFGPLIYGLYKEKSFSNFKLCCEKVWEAVEQIENLPQSLKYCNNDMEWYRSVKKTQGSVEVTSYDQMDNIIEYGCYIVGIKQPFIAKNHFDLVSLCLKEKTNDVKHLAKKSYNLEELRDLESKLVLITGNNADNRKKVELFINTFHCVYHIVDVLLSLQQAGNVHYTGWILQVPCSTSEEIVSFLQLRAKSMEIELKEWNEAVISARCRFYQLNYFTTAQLLTLRLELGALNDIQHTTVPPSVLTLLHSISSEVESANVRTAVKDVALPTTRSTILLSEEDPEESSSCRCTNPTPTMSEYPTIREDELNAEQNNILTFVVQQLSCSKVLVLKAFEECKDKTMNKYDYFKWCNDSIHKYKFEDESCDDDDDDYEYVDDYDDDDHDYEYIHSATFAAIQHSTLSKCIPSAIQEGEENINDGLEQEDITTNWKHGESPKVYCNIEAEGRYLDLEQLGKVLSQLYKLLPGTLQNERKFHIESLICGQPNLLVVPPDQILRTTLYIYMEKNSHPLPSLEEVLICNPSTTAEEIDLFWMRATNNRLKWQIYCLVHAERLSYQVSDFALRSLSSHTQGEKGYRIVIICSNEEEQTSYFISKLHLFKRPFFGIKNSETKELCEYLHCHFSKPAHRMTSKSSSASFASEVDIEK